MEMQMETEMPHTAPPLWCLDERNFATKRGRIIRTVRERYLRDDLSCALPHCGVCVTESDTTAATHVMGTFKATLSATPRNGVYLLPSMALVRQQMDVLEFSTRRRLPGHVELFADVIVLETVWEAVKRHDLGVYNRLRALLTNTDRRFVVFANEHHRASYAGAPRVRAATTSPSALAPRESEEERNARAVAGAWQWYASHLAELQRADVRVLFLANDAADLAAASALGVTDAMTIAQFIAPVQEECPELHDLLAAGSPTDGEATTSTTAAASGGSVSTSGTRAKLYPEHLPLTELLAGVKSKRLFQGVLRCSRDHWLECYVLIHGPDGARVPVLLQGRTHINRAMDGDVVAIQLLPKTQWKAPSDAFAVESSAATKEADEDGDEDGEGPGQSEEAVGVAEPTVSLTQAALVQSDLSLKPAGKVVGILQRNWRKYCGSLEPPRNASDAAGKSRSQLVVPVDRKVPKIKIQTRQADALMDKRILVAIDSWPADAKYPLGHYVQTLGVIGDKETETTVLLIEHDIPCAPFSDDVLKCLPPEDWCITPENAQGRRDLRALPVCSIDPPNCKDIDDALHVVPLPNGHLQVGVHIADVTHFVAPGSALDEEAADRGTSTYLVDRRLDMLPGLLTTKLCSLTDVEDHFAFSVLWEVKLVGDREVEIVDVQFCKSLIRSIASLSYQDAQEYLDDPTAGHVMGLGAPCEAEEGNSNADKRQTLGRGIKTLHAIATRLRAKRIDAGALTLASPEVKFVLDTETQNPLDVQMYTLRDTNALVEEFMLLANITVAKKIVRHFPTFSMLRRHPAPSKRQFELVCSQARAVGVDLQVDSSRQLQDSLDAAQAPMTAEKEAQTMTQKTTAKAQPLTRRQRRAKKKQEAYFNKLLRIMCTRCMMPAAYFSSGEVAPAEFHHYGLAAPIYTHFTSPIRRYADVVVHRLLAAAIGVTPLPHYLENKAHLHEIAEQLNRRHHAAQLAGRASVTLHTLLYFQAHPTTTDAVITKVKNNGVGVLLPRFGIEGMVFLSGRDGDDRDEDTLAFDASRHELTVLERSTVKTGGDDGEVDAEGSTRSPRVLKVFDAVQVRVFVATSFGNRQELKIELLAECEETEEGKEEEEMETNGKANGKTAPPPQLTARGSKKRRTT